MSDTKQLLHTVASSIHALDEFQEVEEKLAEGLDLSLSLPAIMRPAFVATQFFYNPRPILIITENEEGAALQVASLRNYLPEELVLSYPYRGDLPWGDGSPDKGVVAKRTEAQYRFGSGEDVVVVASLPSLMRTISLDDVEEFAPLYVRVGDEREPADVATRLIEMGYERVDKVQEEGQFALRGDILDIYPPTGNPSVRIDFFGDEVESIRRLVPTSSQTISSMDDLCLYPLREIILNEEKRERGFKALEKAAFANPMIEYHRQLIEEGVSFLELDRYLPMLSKRVGILAELAPKNANVYVSNPQTLFNLSVREHERLKVLAKGAPTEGLIAAPADLNFGECARITLVSPLRSRSAEITLSARRSQAAGSDERLLNEMRNLVGSGHAVVFAVENRRLRDRVIELFVEDGIPLGEGYGMLAVLDADVHQGFISQEAKLAVISQQDAFPRSVKKRAKHVDVDVTKITFPFNPGDYVVHSTYGIALFKELTRRVVDGVERDYMHLEYAKGDALFTPIDQIDKITKYVGPDSSSPRLTRLGGKSWARATAKAQAAAKKIAFDLVNLYALRSRVRGYAFSEDTPWQAEMEALFPFEETPDQLEAIADVKNDMESSKPMDRLIVGDVGYGKTEVAIRAAFKAVQDGKQVMVLCPTTILAQQHYINFSERFKPFDIDVEVLSRFRTQAQQRAAVEAFSEGKLSVLIGTHRLLSKDISPHDLGLLVIDEEQRFGVEHKEKLKNMRENIDVLALTATPIPRTLQMSLSGVRDLSLIDTPPQNRHPVKVKVEELNFDTIEHAIRFELARKGQVYYVSNRVKTIDDAVERVVKSAPEARVGVAHGQLSERALEDIMEQFTAGEIDVLVATTIVESGIDNPRANTLIIEDSHRLGLAQLYQLKGRVGRSHQHAFAYFMYPADTEMTPTAIERLMAILEHDRLGAGIKIAMRDLEIRGAGSILGAEQSGQMSAVGFDFFASMIGEEVARSRGEEIKAFPNIRIDLPDAAYIDDEYVEELEDRVLLYRRIAGLATLEGVDKIEKEMLNLFGVLPEPTQNLITLSRVRVMCAEIGAEALTVSGPYLLLKIKKPSEYVLDEIKKLGAIYEERTGRLRWKTPQGKSTVEAARLLVGSLLYDMSEEE